MVSFSKRVQLLRDIMAFSIFCNKGSLTWDSFPLIDELSWMGFNGNRGEVKAKAVGKFEL